MRFLLCGLFAAWESKLSVLNSEEPGPLITMAQTTHQRSFCDSSSYTSGTSEGCIGRATPEATSNSQPSRISSGERLSARLRPDAVEMSSPPRGSDRSITST
eukprot:4345207-Prymnesium_polylepis.2